MNDTTHTELQGITKPLVRAHERESTLTQRLNIPREQFAVWRKSGQWRETEHFTREGNAFVLTDAGAVTLLELLALDREQVPQVKLVALKVICAGAMNRILRCRPVEGGHTVSVRLTGPRVFASAFRKHDKIYATPTDTEGIYEYDGGVPRRVRI